VHQLAFNFTTDAVAGNRIVEVVFRAGGQSIYAGITTQTVAASLTVSINVANSGAFSVVSPLLIAMPIPGDIVLHAGDSINIGEAGGDAGDSIPGNIIYRVEEWLEPVS
jgi:hypothetical protein